MDLGEKIKQLRQKNKMTQNDLGKKLHTSASCISSWERNRTEPNMGQIHELCKLFGISLGEMVGDISTDIYDITIQERDLIFSYRRAPTQTQETIKQMLRYSSYLDKINTLVKEVEDD